MLVLLSPAKRLDEESKIPTDVFTQPDLLSDTKELIKDLKNLSTGELGDLMNLSVPLAQLNYERYKAFSTPFTPKNARQALYLFKGDVYDNMDIPNYKQADLDFAQRHVRLLSGLYGILRPLDLMQPYRLEMGTNFKNSRGKNLYLFWGDKLTDKINETGEDVIINLASNEYFKAVNKKKLKGKLIEIIFKQKKDGKLKTIGLMAKRARGQMTDYIIKNRITNPDELLKFKDGGYIFQPELSKENSWVFTMEM